MDEQIQEATRFMLRRLRTLSQTELISRLNLNLTNSYVYPEQLPSSISITLLSVLDNCSTRLVAQEELVKCYPNAAQAFLKSGGNYPYLSRVDEVNMHLRVHLRRFEQAEVEKNTIEEPEVNSSKLSELEVEGENEPEKCEIDVDKTEYSGEQQTKQWQFFFILCNFPGKNWWYMNTNAFMMETDKISILIFHYFTFMIANTIHQICYSRWQVAIFVQKFLFHLQLFPKRT